MERDLVDQVVEEEEPALESGLEEVELVLISVVEEASGEAHPTPKFLI